MNETPTPQRRRGRPPAGEKRHRTARIGTDDQGSNVVIGRPAVLQPELKTQFLDFGRLETEAAMLDWVEAYGVPTGDESMLVDEFLSCSREFGRMWERFYSSAAARSRPRGNDSKIVRLPDPDTKDCSLAFVNRFVSNVTLRFGWSEGGRVRHIQIAGNALEAMALQFGHAMENQTAFYACVECDRAIAVSSREDTRQFYCDATCRMRATRRRQIVPKILDDLKAVSKVLAERFDEFDTTGLRPLAYCGVGPGVALNDWAGSFYDLVLRGFDRDTVGKHLGWSRGEFMIAEGSIPPELREFPEERRRIGDRSAPTA
jgi:hypothetical protein